jgi:hypothetical protein
VEAQFEFVSIFVLVCPWLIISFHGDERHAHHQPHPVMWMQGSQTDFKYGRL